jgi:hypothetical protein
VLEAAPVFVEAPEAVGAPLVELDVPAPLFVVVVAPVLEPELPFVVEPELELDGEFGDDVAVVDVVDELVVVPVGAVVAPAVVPLWCPFALPFTFPPAFEFAPPLPFPPAFDVGGGVGFPPPANASAGRASTKMLHAATPVARRRPREPLNRAAVMSCPQRHPFHRSCARNMRDVSPEPGT